MSEFDQSFPAAQIAQELGIQLSTEDVPKLVAALHRAYGTGLRDGAATERQACIKVVSDTPWSNWFQSDCVAAIQERGAP